MTSAVAVAIRGVAAVAVAAAVPIGAGGGPPSDDPPATDPFSSPRSRHQIAKIARDRRHRL